MKNKHSLAAIILLAVGAVITLGGVFLFVNRFAPM